MKPDSQLDLFGRLRQLKENEQRAGKFARPLDSSLPTLRETGMTRAADHADAEVDRWCDRAGLYLCTFAATKAGSFTCEDVRIAATVDGFPTPPDERAWGAVIRRAANRGKLRPAGLTVIAGTPRRLWIAPL